MLSERLRVLLVDTDPQASLTLSLLADIPRLTLADVLDKRVTLADAITPISERLFIVAANQRLTATENTLRTNPAGVFALSKALTTAMARADVCLIDCMPTLSQLVTGALVVSDGVLIPSRPEANDIRGLSPFMALLADVKEIPGAHCELIGIVATMIRTGSTSHAEGVEALAKVGPVIGRIGQTVQVSSASANLTSIADVDSGNARATEYRALAGEIAKWIRRKNAQ